jgi:hypothetical protein
MNQLKSFTSQLASLVGVFGSLPMPGWRKLVRQAWAILLAGQLCRAMAQDENQVGVRQEYYVEKDDRIKVDTQSAFFDVAATSKIRLSGTLVLDAISGATPIGAPPPNQWQYPSFTDYYKSYYKETYTAKYGEYVAANQVFVDAGLKTPEQVAREAAAYAAPIAASTARQSAVASTQELHSNPNYKSNQVPLTHMDDNRTAFSLASGFTFGHHLATPSFAYSEESDYKSYVGALNYAFEFNQKNTTLNFGVAHNEDSVRDDLFEWQNKRVDSFMVGGTQLLSPKSYLTFSASLVNESGYLSDPYRQVMFTTTEFNELQTNPSDPTTDPERRPGNRFREIGYVAYSQFIDALHGGMECSYRFSYDSWSVLANTIDLRWHQKLGRKFVLSPSFRYHLQSAADFYYPGLVPGGYGKPDTYSSDYRLSHLQTFAYGLQLTWRLSKYFSLDAGYQLYVMEGLDATSPSAYPTANVFNFGGRLWF